MFVQEQVGRVVSASVSGTSVWSSTPARAIVYDACTSIIKKKKLCIRKLWKIGICKAVSGPDKIFNPFKYWTIVHCLGFCPYLNKQTEILVRFIKSFKTVLSAILVKQLPSGPFFIFGIKNSVQVGTFISSVRLAAVYFLTSAKENYSVSTLYRYI